MSKRSVRGDLHGKNSIRLKFAERIGVAAAARELSLYESQSTTKLVDFL